jgi:low temperature requirement protein LtrA
VPGGLALASVRRDEPPERSASWLELFFDLVLVAAVGALAAELHDEHSLAGLARFAALFVPVWWGYTWYSTAFNDDDAVNRVALLAAMACVAALAAGVAGAADGRSDTFVVAYAGLFALLAALYGRAWVRVPAARTLSARYVLGLVIAAAIWWLYFDRWRGMPAGGIRSGFVWAQGHLLVFAGIAAAAVGVEFAIEAAAEGHDLVLADRLPLGSGLAAYLLAMALIRGATRRVDWIVVLRLAAAGVVLGPAFLDGLAPLAFAGLVALIMAAECAVDLIGFPPEPGLPKPALPHEVGRRRHPAGGLIDG